MLFSSVIFIYWFLPIVLLLYYVLFRGNRKWQNIFLLLVSLLFYAWGEPYFVLIMMASIAVNYYFGLLVNSQKKKGNVRTCKTLIVLTVVFNLLILFVFKYLTFALTTVNDMLDLSLPVPAIALPIGISFFTFQAMSYVFDVYRGRGEVQRSILDVGLYISFFPQLIAGPIVRYQTVAWEIKNRKETIGDISDGFCRFIVGLAKKVLLSNSFALVADRVFDLVAGDGSISTALGWLGAICYTLQIFFDFGGYSDMAIGLGKMFGFHFPENFDYPYISKSVTEFWRRWHISLGSWFRDYVYIPLGGSRVNTAKLIRNLFVVWLLTGIWHGANWTFIVWGLMYFVLLTFEKLTGLSEVQNKACRPAMWAYTMFFVIIGWVLFRSGSLQDAARYLGFLFGIGSASFVDGLFMTELKSIHIQLVFGLMFSVPLFPAFKEKVRDNAAWHLLSAVALVLLFLLSIASLEGNSYNPFIYFNF